MSRFFDWLARYIIEPAARTWLAAQEWLAKTVWMHMYPVSYAEWRARNAATEEAYEVVVIERLADGQPPPKGSIRIQPGESKQLPNLEVSVPSGAEGEVAIVPPVVPLKAGETGAEVADNAEAARQMEDGHLLEALAQAHLTNRPTLELAGEVMARMDRAGRVSAYKARLYVSQFVGQARVAHETPSADAIDARNLMRNVCLSAMTPKE